MKRSLLLSVLLTVLFLLPSTSFSQTSTQVIGKLYTKTEANQLYGAVKNSIEISTSTLSSLLQKAPDYILFNILDGKLIFFDKNKNQIWGPVQNVSSISSFRIVSSSQVAALLKIGENSITTFETRDSVVTVTNGNETLEQTLLCPPYWR